MSRAATKAEIEEAKKRIEGLEQQVADAQAATAEAMRAIHVQTRYASRVQNVARSEPQHDGFLKRMHRLIDADKAALSAKGK